MMILAYNLIQLDIKIISLRHLEYQLEKSRKQQDIKIFLNKKLVISTILALLDFWLTYHKNIHQS